jgi:hypothetical protein
MARSIHATKKALVRERRFAHTDEVPKTGDLTELELQDIQKILYKTNEALRRQAVNSDAPSHAIIALKDSEVTRAINKRKTKKF